MTNMFEYMIAANQAGLEAASKLAKVSFEKTEAFSRLAWDFSRSSMEDMSKQAQSVAQLRDPSEFVASRTKATEAAAAKAAQFGREAYTLATAAQLETRKVVEDRIASMQKDAASFVETAAKSAPAGSEYAVTALKNMVSASAVAMDNMNKASKQAAGFMDAALKAGETTAENVKSFSAAQGKRK